MRRPKLFMAFADTAWRRQVLSSRKPLPDEHIFYGMRQLRSRGYGIRHNLERRPSGKLGHRLNRLFNTVLNRLGGFGGEWSAVLPHLSVINSAGLVFSTVDRVGIPLVMLKHFGLVKPPLVYVSIGLPERLACLRNARWRRLYRRAFRTATSIVCYGFEEANQLRQTLDIERSRVRFIPFGVSTDWFYPMPDTAHTIDILSVGRDPNREFSIMLEFARHHPEYSVTIITSQTIGNGFEDLPENVRVLVDVPLVQLRAIISQARVVALPVRANSYSGATTTMLECMAMARPVVVSRVGAIEHGYSLKDGVNCRLVTPGDPAELANAVVELLANPEKSETIGSGGKELVRKHHSWDGYVDALDMLFCQAVESAYSVRPEMHSRSSFTDPGTNGPRRK